MEDNSNSENECDSSYFEADTTLLNSSSEETKQETEQKTMTGGASTAAQSVSVNQQYSVDAHMRLQDVNEVLNRFQPDNAGKWFEDAKEANDYAGIEEKTALRNIATRVNDHIPPTKKKLKVEASDTYDTFKTRLETAFEPNMKKTLGSLMNNYELGDQSVEEYLRKLKTVIGDGDEKSKQLILTLINQVLPSQTFKIEANKLYFGGKTLEEVALEMDKLLERFSEVGGSREPIIAPIMQATGSATLPVGIRQGLLDRLGECKKEPEITSTGADPTVELAKRLARIERFVDDSKVQSSKDKMDIINSIQDANMQAQQRSIQEQNRREKTSRDDWRTPGNERRSSDYSNNDRSARSHRRAEYYGEGSRRADPSPYRERYQSPRRERSREDRRPRYDGYSQRQQEYDNRGEEQRRSGRDRNRHPQNNYQGRENRSSSRPTQQQNKQNQNDYQRGDVCFYHWKYGDECFPEMCKIGCSLHPSGICYYHYQYGDNAYTDKCPRWCKHPAKQRRPKNA